MAFKEHKSNGSANWVTIGGFTKDGQKNPSSITGYYLGRTESTSNFDATKTKTTYMLNVNGTLVGVNGAANLNIQMKDWEINARAKEGKSVLGMRVKIEFTGTAPSKKGSATKLYKVSYDPDDVNTEKPMAGTEVGDEAATVDTEQGDYEYGTTPSNGAATDAQALIATAKKGADQEKIKKMFDNKGKKNASN